MSPTICSCRPPTRSPRCTDGRTRSGKNSASRAVSGRRRSMRRGSPRSRSGMPAGSWPRSSSWRSARPPAPPPRRFATARSCRRRSPRPRRGSTRRGLISPKRCATPRLPRSRRARCRSIRGFGCAPPAPSRSWAPATPSPPSTASPGRRRSSKTDIYERRLRDAFTLSQQIQSRANHYATVGRHLLGMEVDTRWV